MNNKLLIVDDETANLRLLERLFRHDYFCLTASSGAEAIKLLEQHDVAVVITDQRMPQMTGIELLKQTAELRPQMVRILLTGYTDVEALVEAINCGLIYMYVPKPWSNDDLKTRVSRALEHYENNKKQHALEVANGRLGAQVREMKAGFVRALTELLKQRKGDAYYHAVRVNHYSSLIAQEMELPEDACLELSAAALLHQIGILTADHGYLDANANNTQEHASGGEQIFSMIPELRQIADIVRFQPENFDGSGSPQGFIGDQIPLSSRILRVADEYVLMLGPKDSQTAASAQDAIDALKERSGKVFDPRVVQVLAQFADAGRGDSRNFGLSSIHREPASTGEVLVG